MIQARLLEDVTLQIQDKIKARDALKIKNDALYREISANILRRKAILQEIRALERQRSALKHAK
jgi:hypothetical protein